MPETAITPFREDVARAKTLMVHATPLPHAIAAEKLLRDDILRSAWMFAVGAMDAYFCDAYADLIASTLMAKSNQPEVDLPEFVGKIEIPVTAVLEDYAVRQNWKWRMAARQMMADKNSLEIATIKSWFNKFCRPGHTMFKSVIPTWIRKAGATHRVFGVAPRHYRAADQDKANKGLLTRFENIVQRRHDCIHTCDRPANQPQPIYSGGTVKNVIKDIDFIVEQSNAHIDVEFREWLLGCGFSSLTVNQVGY
jgi:hypothetical protein